MFDELDAMSERHVLEFYPYNLLSRTFGGRYFCQNEYFPHPYRTP
jgi:hypothetical protein